MAGSSSITLFRSEDATIAMQFQAREAAQVLAADLSSGTLRLVMRVFPRAAVILTLTPAAPVSGCVLSLTFPIVGQASLFIPLAFWSGRPDPVYELEAFLDTPAGTRRLGDHLITLAE